MERIYSARLARTLYNVAEVQLSCETRAAPGGGEVDVLPLLERRLRHQGLRTIRRLGLLLGLLEWAPLLRGRLRPLWRLSVEERRALLGTLAGWPGVGSGLDELRKRLEQAAREAAAEAAPLAARASANDTHSLEGA